MRLEHVVVGGGKQVMTPITASNEPRVYLVEQRLRRECACTVAALFLSGSRGRRGGTFKERLRERDRQRELDERVRRVECASQSMTRQTLSGFDFGVSSRLLSS